MQSVSQKDSQRASITALSVMAAHLRSLRRDPSLSDTFDDMDVRLTDIAYQTATRMTPKRGNFGTMLWSVIARLPDSMQRFISWALIKTGYDSFITTRKAAVKSKIQQSIQEEGTEQLLILGGGYDPRGLISAQSFEGIQVFEVDTGLTRDIKHACLERIAKDVTFEKPLSLRIDATLKSLHVEDNFHLIDSDLTQDNLIDKLNHVGFDPTKKTLVVAEGLTMYLSESSIRALFDSLNQLLSDESEILTSFKYSTRQGLVVNRALKSNTEDYQFSLSPEKVNPFLSELGFYVKSRFTQSTWMNFISSSILRGRNEPILTPYYTLAKGSIEQSLEQIPEGQLPVFHRRRDTVQEGRVMTFLYGRAGMQVQDNPTDGHQPRPKPKLN